MSKPLRVVLDSNVVLSSLLFRNAAADRLRHGWRKGEFVPLASTQTAGELLRVLAYPKFRLTAQEQHELLADYLPFTASVRIPQPPPSIPACRDPLDAAFLELAAAGHAKWLVSGDKDLLILTGMTRFQIITPADFLRRLDDN